MDKSNPGSGRIPFYVVAGLCGLILIKYGVLKVVASESCWAQLSGDAGLLLITVPFIFYGFRQYREKEKQVCRLNKELQQLSSDFLLIHEKERRKIAMDLHDRIGQNLSLSLKKIESLRSESKDAVLADRYGDVADLLGQTINDTRSLTFELSPHILYDEGLEGALDWLCDKTEKDHAIRVEFLDDLKEKPLSVDSRILLYRCVRELLINSVKHSQAKNIRVSIERPADALRIEVCDDGSGFGPDIGNDKKQSFGLSSVREQVKYHKGDLRIESAPGKGASVTIIYPINHLKTNES